MKVNTLSDSFDSKLLLSPHETPDDVISHEFIPVFLDDYIGQTHLKERLKLHIISAQKRETCLDHILFSGPPGLGKTTLATIVAKSMNTTIKITSGPVLQKGGDLVAILSQLKKNNVLFIDEIHRIPLQVEEILYSAMEQFKVDIIIGQGVGAKSVSIPIQPFTLIGATTKSGLLSAPLRSRFGILEKLEWYTIEELQKIIHQAAEFYHIALSDEACVCLAHCSRNTPRIAKKLIKRIRDFIIVNNFDKKDALIEKSIIDNALKFFGIIQGGLTNVDLHILSILINRHDPMGIESLSVLIGEEPRTIEDVYEPFLLQQGYIERTPRGRIIAKNKYEDIKKLLNMK